MKIFTCEQIKKIDLGTIKEEPVSSVDLMERAAGQILRWILKNFDRSREITIFTGPGNNGGDGLVLARLLRNNRYGVHLYNIYFSSGNTDDWRTNYQRLEEETDVPVTNITSKEQFPILHSSSLVIDAIFGSGLNRPADGLAAEVIKLINQSDGTVVSVDIPSGLFCEDNSANNPDSVINADFTLSLQFPKLSFLFPENSAFTGEWITLPIGLSNKIIRETESPFFYLDDEFVRPLIRNRKKFDHKGIYGHGLLIAGSYGKMGAAILAARAAMKTGMGLITCHIPRSGNPVIQSSFPEAMTRSDNDENIITKIGDTESFDALAAGPGLSTDTLTQKAMHSLLLNRNRPLVIDADGLNILGMNPKWLSVLPPDTILTPHPREFERMAGKSENSYRRLERQREFASDYNCIVILKGAYTSIAFPDGRIFFNSTGNPGMATAGSGDVLTGMVLSLLAQGYTPQHAAITAVYIHGLAGDIASAKHGQESIIASDIIDNIGNAFLKLKSSF